MALAVIRETGLSVPSASIILADVPDKNASDGFAGMFEALPEPVALVMAETMHEAYKCAAGEVNADQALAAIAHSVALSQCEQRPPRPEPPAPSSTAPDNPPARALGKRRAS